MIIIMMMMIIIMIMIMISIITTRVFSELQTVKVSDSELSFSKLQKSGCLTQILF